MDDMLLAASGLVQSAYVAKFNLEQHCAYGHRPYCVKCPWCVIPDEVEESK